MKSSDFTTLSRLAEATGSGKRSGGLREKDALPLALLLSYSFDPAFFEHLVLPDLVKGRIEETAVVADALQVEQSVGRNLFPLTHLGRRYLLAPVALPGGGAFHPKIWVRAGAEGGVAWVGSGNLTRGGWGHNTEAAQAWAFGPEQGDTGAWIRDLLSLVSELAGSPLLDRAMERFSELEWLPGTGGTEGPPGGAPSAPSVGPNRRLLVSGRRTLSQGLEGLLRGRRFDTLHFTTGSTDARGGMLRWVAETFGVERAVGVVTPSRTALARDEIRDLPLDLRLVAEDEKKMMHAKTYRLSGPEGNLIIVGSANATPAAWLRPIRSGGNVEAVVVYEDPSPDDLALFARFDTHDPLPPAAVLPASPPPEIEEPEPSPSTAYVPRILSFQLEETGRLLVEVTAIPPEGYVLTAVIGHEEHSLSSLGPVPGALSPQGSARHHFVSEEEVRLPVSGTAFGRIRARDPAGRSTWSSRRWIDNLRLLHEPRAPVAMADAFKRMRPPGPGRKDAQFLEELMSLASSILDDEKETRSPHLTLPPKHGGEPGGTGGRRAGTGGRSNTDGGPEREGDPIADPAALVISLSFAEGEGGRFGSVGHRSGQSTPAAESVTGIFRAIFGKAGLSDDGEWADGEDSDGAGIAFDEAETLAEEGAGSSRPDPDPPGPGREIPAAAGSNVTAIPSHPTPPADEPNDTQEPALTAAQEKQKLRLKQKFLAHLKGFCAALLSPRFRETVSPRQAVQVIAYPMVAISRGMEKGWVDSADGVRLATDIIRTLVIGQKTDDLDLGPLMTELEDRYEEEGRQDQFLLALERGALWVALVMSMAEVRESLATDTEAGEGGSSTGGSRGFGVTDPRLLEWGILLRSLWNAHALQGSARPEDIEGLIRAYRGRARIADFQQKVGPVAQSFNRIQDRLRLLHEQVNLTEFQAELGEEMKEGDLLWSERNGWVFISKVEGEGRVRVYWPRKGSAVPMKPQKLYFNVSQAAALDGELGEGLREMVLSLAVQNPGAGEREGPNDRRP